MLKMGTINVNGISQIAGIRAAYFNVTFQEGGSGNYTISKNVADASVYAQHQSECDADYAEFEKLTRKCVNEISSQSAESEEE